MTYNAESIKQDILNIYNRLSDYRKVPPDESLSNALLRDVQGNKCIICKSNEYLIEDHCHKTGMVRGLLCRGCNITEGKMINEEPWITYRKYHPANGLFYRYKGINQQWLDNYPDPLPKRISFNVKVSDITSGELTKKVEQYKLMVKYVPEMEIPYTCHRLFNENREPIPFTNENVIKIKTTGEWPFTEIKNSVTINNVKKLQINEKKYHASIGITSVFNKNSLKSESTIKSYENDMIQYAQWCEKNKFIAMPSDHGALSSFLISLAESGLKYATIERKKSAIAYAHKINGFLNPSLSQDVCEAVGGIRNSLRSSKYQKKAITDLILIEMLKHCSCKSLRGIRDRAILSSAFLSGLKRSDFIQIKVENITFEKNSVDIFIERSGKTISLKDELSFKIKSTIIDWIDISGIKQGYLFRPFKKGSAGLNDRNISASYFAELIKHYVTLSGEDCTDFSGNSMKIGLKTSLKNKKVDTAIGYIDEADSYEDHASENFA